MVKGPLTMRHLVILTAALAACTEPERDTLCRQTYEFGNFGCAIISGTVSDRNDSPLAGAWVNLGSGEDAHDFAYAPALSSADGTFTMRITRYGPSTPPVEGDTATLWVRAAHQTIPTAEGLLARDSVLVRIRVVGVGQMPDTAVVLLRLPIP